MKQKTHRTRIWYSAIGEGLGHAVRSETILKRLVPQHDVIITASGKAYHHLKTCFPQVTHICGGGWIYRKNQIKIVRSALWMLLTLPYKIVKNGYITLQLFHRFKPEIIITDFEPTALIMGQILHIPIIEIDNIQAIAECAVKLPKIHRKDFFFAHFFLRSPLFPRAQKYFIPSFSSEKVRHPERTTLIRPIISKEVRALKPERKKHVLVYQTSPSNRQILPVLEQTPFEFRIYGMKPEKRKKNLVFRPPSRKGFLEDLRTCSWVLLNGGFTLISEALELQKPILAIPIAKQTEQLYNAYALYRCGYGDYTKRLTHKNIFLFVKRLPSFCRRLKQYQKSDPKEVITLINDYIATIQNHPSA